MQTVRPLPAMTLTLFSLSDGAARDKDVGSRFPIYRRANPKSELVPEDGTLHAVKFNFRLNAEGGNHRSHAGAAETVAADTLDTVERLMTRSGLPMAGQPRLEVTRTAEKGAPANLEAQYAIGVTVWVPADSRTQIRLPRAKAAVSRYFLQ